MAFGDRYDSANDLIRFTDWAEFKKYLDGTYDSRAFDYVIQGATAGSTTEFYYIITDGVAGTRLTLTLTKATPTPGGSDQEDFEDNFAALSETRVPSLDVNVASIPLPSGAATEATLASIKNTDGIKKITDALPTGANVIGGVTQSGTWTVTGAGGTFPVTDSGGSLTVDSPQLPASLVGSRLDVNNGAWLGSTAPTVGQKTMTASLPVTIASNQSTLPVSVASLPLPTGAATEATLASIKNTDGIKKITDALPTGSNTIGAVTQSGTWTVQPGNTANTTAWLVTGTGGTFPVTDNGGSLTVDSLQLPAALVGSRLDVNNGAWLGSTAPTVGQKAMVASIPVAIASDQSAIPTQAVKGSSATTANVTASTSSVTILAANTNRLGAMVYNDSNKDLYLKFGSAASATSFTVNIPKEGYFEVPYNYTGILTGAWDSGVSGAARVTEVT